MRAWDVVVVGAGPAGSIAAHELAKRGVHTLLLEKFRLPRDKPCGGAVMYRGLRIVHRVPRRLVQRPVHGLRFVMPDGSSAQFRSEQLIGITTNRAEFDEYLAYRAVDGGAELLEDARVISVEVRPDRVVTRLSDGREFSSSFVIGADGVNTVVGPSVGLRPSRKNLYRVGLGMESDFHVGEERVLEASGGDPTILEIRPVENRVSYGWVFPKREHLAIGIAGAAVHMQPLRSLFDGFVAHLEREFGFPLVIERRRTHFLGADGVRNKNVTGRVILVGDAAGFVDPMMGEGIAYAMQSGLFAARVMTEALERGRYDEAFLSRYDRLCRDRFGANFSMAEWAGTRGTSFAGSVLRVAAGLRMSSDILAMLARGDIGYSDIPPVVLSRLPRELPHLIGDYVRNRLLRHRKDNA